MRDDGQCGRDKAPFGVLRPRVSTPYRLGRSRLGVQGCKWPDGAQTCLVPGVEPIEPREGEAVKYTRLGRTGLRVSRIGLGCMSYGNPAVGIHSWTLDEDAASGFFRQAVELGVTFWDTANVYQGGTSEEFVGRQW